MTARPLVEVAVAGARGAATAARVGADRIELSAGLELGGLTPSAAAVELCVAGPLPVAVLIRCRPGDFCYEAEDVAVMARDAELAARAGAEAVVVGALTREGGVDVDGVRRLAEAAREGRADVAIVLSRAIDLVADPTRELARLESVGVARVLTSGGAPRAVEGLGVIGGLAAEFPRLEVVAGGGVSAADVAALSRAGARAVHLSAKRRADPPTGRPWVALGAAIAGPESDTHFETDASLAAAAVDAARALG